MAFDQFLIPSEKSKLFLIHAVLVCKNQLKSCPFLPKEVSLKVIIIFFGGGGRPPLNH